MFYLTQWLYHEASQCRVLDVILSEAKDPYDAADEMESTKGFFAPDSTQNDIYHICVILSEVKDPYDVADEIEST